MSFLRNDVIGEDNIGNPKGRMILRIRHAVSQNGPEIDLQMDSLFKVNVIKRFT